MTDLYFAFPDATLAYHCADCDQRCCKTGYLPLLAREQEQLVQLRPALELVAVGQAGATQLFATPRDACWFLSGTRCELVAGATDGGPLPADQAKGGGVGGGLGWGVNEETPTTLRPSTCTLFPFNVFGRLGDTIVIAPNALCPLQVEPGQGTRFEELVPLVLAYPQASLAPAVRAADSAELLRLELVVRDACVLALEQQTPFALLAFVHDVTESFVQGGVEGLATCVPASPANGLETWAQRATESFEVPAISAADWALVQPLLCAWFPALRLFALEHVALQDLAHHYLGLWILAAHWVRTHGRTLTPHSLCQMASACEPRIATMLRAND